MPLSQAFLSLSLCPKRPCLLPLAPCPGLPIPLPPNLPPALPTPLTLQTLTLPGYAVTIDNGTFTWAQDLPPTLHRYQLLPSLLSCLKGANIQSNK